MLVTDTRTSEDLLGRKRFARQIVYSLKQSFYNKHDGIVVGISGSWGCGKSTLLEYINNEIIEQYSKNSIKFKVLKFNSWGNSGEDDIERKFLEKILQTVSEFGFKSEVRKADSKIKDYLKYLKKTQFLKNIHPVVKNLYEGLDEYLNTEISLEDIKKEVNTLLDENSVKLFILIDDLDRLTPKEITTLFKVLKVNFNLLNTVFVIAYDKEVVINALANEYSIDGEKYLEKIIQIDFAIPAILKDQLREIFFDRLEIITAQLNVDVNLPELVSIWKLYGFNEYFKSIRDINRYFNNLVFSLPNIGADIDLRDFLLVEAIRTFDNNAYNNLYIDVPRINRKQIWMSIDIDESFLSKYRNETTNAVLNFLFLAQKNKVESISDKRLRNRSYFERYFSLSVPYADISEETFSIFFTENSDKKSLMKQIYREGKMMNFLQKVKGMNDEQKLNDLGIFRKYIDFWESLAYKIPADFKALIIDVYFKFIHLFSDTYESSREAVRNLMMTSSESNKIKMIINHFILLKQIPSPSHDDKGQIMLHLTPLTKYFIEYLNSQYGFYFLKIKEGSAGWIEQHFIHSLACHLPNLYVDQLNNNISDPQILSFIASNFYMYETEDKVGALSGRSTEMLFPGNTLEKAIVNIKEMSGTVLPENQYRALKFFAENIKTKTML